jgi:flagellar biosynthesis protein FliQ
MNYLWRVMMIAGIDVIEVLLGVGILVYGWMLIYMLDFNKKVINNDRHRTKKVKG